MKKNITEENIFMEKHIDSVLSLEWKPVPGGVVYLPSIVKYKDKQSIAQALLDDDFCNKTLAMVASAVLKKDDQERKLSLSALQLYCNYSDLRKIALALDNKGYMYETHRYVADWKWLHVRYREHTHEPTLTEIIEEYQKQCRKQQEKEKKLKEEQMAFDKYQRWKKYVKEQEKKVSQKFQFPPFRQNYR